MTLSASTDSIHTVNATTTLARPGGPRLAGPLLRTQSDERLAALAREGSQQAFDEMVKRHRPQRVAPRLRLRSTLSSLRGDRDPGHRIGS